MKRGILIIAFGSEYRKIAEACISISKQHTDLPICLLTNTVLGDTNADMIRWMDLPVEENRDVKTRMIQYTPFDETLYLDCDSVIQRPLIEEEFDRLADYDVILNPLLKWGLGDKVLILYKKTMLKFGATIPISIYNGALVLFKKNPVVESFFNRWNHFWNKTGRGREMPSLACTTQLTEGLKVGELPPHTFAAEYLDSLAKVQHHCEGFVEKFSLPSWEAWTPFDSDPSDFRWTTMGENNES